MKLQNQSRRKQKGQTMGETMKLAPKMRIRMTNPMVLTKLWRARARAVESLPFQSARVLRVICKVCTMNTVIMQPIHHVDTFLSEMSAPAPPVLWFRFLFGDRGLRHKTAEASMIREACEERRGGSRAIIRMGGRQETSGYGGK